MSSNPAALDAQTTEHPAGPAIAAALAPWLFIAFTPVFFAAATWNEMGQADPFVAAIRLFGIPVAIVELSVIAMAVFRGWHPLRQVRSLSPTAPLLLGLLIAIASFSAVFAPRPAGALIWSYLSFIHLLFGLSVAHLVSIASTFERRCIWPTIVLGMCAYTVMLLVFVNRPHSSGFDWQYLGLAVSNVRQLGYYAVVGGSAALACSVQSRGRKGVAFGAAAALVLAMLFWSGSRGALVAIATTIAGLATVMPAFRSVRAFCIFLSVGAASVVLSLMQNAPFPLYGVGRIVQSSLHGQADADFSSGRLEMWKGAGEAILKRPLLGYGEGQFGFVVRLPQDVYLHPHNVLLQSLFQWGILGTMVSLLLAALLFRRCLESGRKDPLTTVPALMVTVALAVMSLFDGALFHTYPLMMFSLSVGIIAAKPSACNDGVSIIAARQHDAGRCDA